MKNADQTVHIGNKATTFILGQTQRDTHGRAKKKRWNGEIQRIKASGVRTIGMQRTPTMNAKQVSRPSEKLAAMSDASASRVKSKRRATDHDNNTERPTKSGRTVTTKVINPLAATIWTEEEEEVLHHDADAIDIDRAQTPPDDAPEESSDAELGKILQSLY